MHIAAQILPLESPAMPACARREIVHEGAVGVYHVYNRCVRRAFLCGEDPLTGQNYDHRRDWITAMERQLAALFGIDIGFHVEMSNHLHLILRTRPDIVDAWSPEELARRWLTINRLVHSRDGHTIRPVTENEITRELSKPNRVEVLRARLSSVSELMKALCEHVARRANREDDVTGAFFEGRFDCRDLADEASILVCGVYIDLNQIRAGEALTPEESRHTSAFDRIQGRRKDSASAAPDGWMCELTVDERSAAYQGPQPSQSGQRASDMGLLPIRLEEYLELLDWTGRSLVAGKQGAIPGDLAPILDRLGIKQSRWLQVVSQFEQLFGHVVGRAAQLAQRAAAAGRSWYHGRAVCAEVFG